MQPASTSWLPPFARIPAIGIVLLLILVPNGSAQSLGPLDRGRGRDMLHMLRKDMERYYYDSTFRGMDLAPVGPKPSSGSNRRPLSNRSWPRSPRYPSPSATPIPCSSPLREA
jgi:hypothetical protein